MSIYDDKEIALTYINKVSSIIEAKNVTIEYQREQIKMLTETLRDLLPIVNRVILSDDEDQALQRASVLAEYPTRKQGE